MSKKQMDELTYEEKERLARLRERDAITDFIVDNMEKNNSEIDLDIVEAIEKQSFMKQEYYVAAEVLFHTGASVEWINIVLKVIAERNSDVVVDFIREIVYAYNNQVKVETVDQFIDACDFPVELHAFTEEIINKMESNNKVRETIECIPELIGKIESDSLEAKQNYIDMKEQLDQKKQELDGLKEQVETAVSGELYEKAVKKADYFERKFKESQKSLRNCKDECVHLKSKQEEMEQKIKDNDQAVVFDASNAMADELKKFFDEKLNDSIDNIAKTVSNSYMRVLNAVESSKPETPNFDESKEIKKIISQQEDIIHAVESMKNESVINMKSPDPDPQQEEMNDAETQPVEFDEPELTDDYVITENEMLGDIPADFPESIEYEEPVATDKKEDDEPNEEQHVEEHVEPDINMCKAPELLEGKILSSKAKDDKEEKKIGFFAHMKFKCASDKKQKQLILDLMLRKRIPVETVNAVKKIMNSGKVDNKFVFNLINDERATDETIASALEYVS